MMGERTVMQEALFYSFRIEDHVPQDHLLRSVDRFVDLTGVREHLKPFYSSTGRPSVDPELMIRMLLIGYCMGIRSERRLCDEVHLNLAYRWFCRLDLDGAVPDHSTFSKNRHGRFRDSDLLRKLFDQIAHEYDDACDPVRFAADVHHKLMHVYPFRRNPGTTARLFTNLLLLSRGYPPLIVTCDQRDAYYQALAHPESDELADLFSDAVSLLLERAGGHKGLLRAA